MSRIETFVNGYLGKDAEIKTVESGRQVINFTIAHGERYKDGSGEWKEKTVWVGCAIWLRDNQEDKITQHLKKGTNINIWGYPQPEAWIDKETGAAKCQLRIRVDRWDLCAKPKQSDQGGIPAENYQHNAAPSDDDLPF